MITPHLITWSVLGLVFYALIAWRLKAKIPPFTNGVLIVTGGPVVWMVWLLVTLAAAAAGPATGEPPEDPVELLGELHDYLAELLQDAERADGFTVLDPAAETILDLYLLRIERIRGQERGAQIAPSPQPNPDHKTP